MNSELLLDNQTNELDERELWCDVMTNRKVMDKDEHILPLGICSGMRRNAIRWARLAYSRRRTKATAALAVVVFVAIYCLALYTSWTSPRCISRFWLLPASREQLQSGFASRTTAAERVKLLSTLRVLSQALGPVGVTYFLYAGTLLGSYRHHGLVPWDDDVDILANYSQIRQLTNALSSVTGYKLYTGYPLRYKFYPSDGNPIAGKDWRWPYVDICFFGESATHVFDVVPGLTASANYPKEYVFPLVHRPYEGFMLPAPRHSRQVILIDIGDLGRCASNTWSHRAEADTEKYLQCNAPCELLFDWYPFVSHYINGSRTIEELRFGNVSLLTYTPEDRS